MRWWGGLVSCHDHQCHHGCCVGILLQPYHHEALRKNKDEGESDDTTEYKAFVSTDLWLSRLSQKLIASRVCVATIVQISSLAGSLTATDQTWAMMRLVVIQQVVMNLSILTAVVLGLHSFIANLTAGGFSVEVRDSTNELSNASYGRSRLATGVSKTSSRVQRGNHPHSSHRRLSRVRRDGEAFRPHQVAESTAWAQHEDWEETGRRSHSSQENIILQTVSWQVSRDVTASTSPSGHQEQTLPSHEEPQEASARNFVV